MHANASPIGRGPTTGFFRTHEYQRIPWESKPVRNVVRGAQFRRDVKLAQKRGKDMQKLRELMLLLIEANREQPAIRANGLREWDHLSCRLPGELS